MSIDPKTLTAILTLGDWAITALEKIARGGELPQEVRDARIEVRKALSSQAQSRTTRKKTSKKTAGGAASQTDE